jgi:DNA-3-methyladenine glycosylase
VDGISLMLKRRGVSDVRTLCNGPGKLVQALGITRQDNGISLLGPPLFITAAESVLDDSCIESSVRRGITKAADLPLRFFIRENQFVS